MFRSVAALMCCLLVYSVSAESATQTELSSGGRLRYYGADEEDFFVSPDYSSIVRASDGNLVQKKYDTQYRLIKKTTWNEGSNMPSSITDYTYNDGVFPVSSQAQEITSERFISEIYNTSGLVIHREVYSTARVEDESTDDSKLDDEISDDSKLDDEISDNAKLDGVISENINTDDTISDDSVENATDNNIETDVQSMQDYKILLYVQTWEYDKDNRVVAELIEYADDLIQSEKIEYDFLAGEDKPDVFYYKGGNLFKKIVYSSPDDWEESVYFPDEIEIKTIYKERTAVSEEFYQNGTKIRERKR